MTQTTYINVTIYVGENVWFIKFIQSDSNKTSYIHFLLFIS